VVLVNHIDILVPITKINISHEYRLPVKTFSSLTIGLKVTSSLDRPDDDQTQRSIITSPHASSALNFIYDLFYCNSNKKVVFYIDSKTKKI